MARSVRIVLAFTAFALAACSAKPNEVGANGRGNCPAGLTCDDDPATMGDADDGDGSGTGDGSENGDGSGSGDGSGTGDGDGEADAGKPPESVEGECKPENIVPEGCIDAVDSENSASLCDHVDNDCDGQIDEGCVCIPGTVQRCFAGPPGRRGVGGCDDGTQLCEGSEFGNWGACTGGQPPVAEVCDSLDNDCNGCIDEIEDCQPKLTCPAPGNPRIPDGKPFSDYALRGGDFVMNTAAVATWKWTVEGTPCDQLFLSIPGSPATAENGQLSFTLSGANAQDANLKFTLSGDYKVTMTATFADGTVTECSWIVHVRAPGVRVELCWDQTGPTAVGHTVDVDLHLGKHGTTEEWFDGQDCYYGNCKIVTFSTPPEWGYADSGTGNCPTGIASCPNPRLDIDNMVETSSYKPENINVDVPKNGDAFRVMVHYWNAAGVSGRPGPETHPLVNVYCGGELRGTFGAGADRLTGFDTGGGDLKGDMWRVVDVTSEVSAGITTGCGLAPLAVGGVPNVTTNDPTF